MTKKPLRDVMNDSFHELQARQAEIEKRLAPVREKYNEVSARIEQMTRDELDPVVEEKRRIEAELFEVNQETSQIVKFLRGGGHFAETGEIAKS